MSVSLRPPTPKLSTPNTKPCMLDPKPQVTVTTAFQGDAAKGSVVNVILQRNDNGLLVDMERCEPYRVTSLIRNATPLGPPQGPGHWLTVGS